MRLSSDETYENIKTLEVELEDLSGEGYRVRYDFERRMINWTDKYMWNNNFMKTLNERKFTKLCEELPQSELLSWIEAYAEGENNSYGKRVAAPAKWSVNVSFDDGKLIHAEAVQHFPFKWNILKHIIEETSDCYFKLR